MKHLKLLDRSACVWLASVSDWFDMNSFQVIALLTSSGFYVTRCQMIAASDIVWLGVSRYQIIAGVDRYLFGHSTLLWSYLAATGFLRFTSHAVSQQSRLHFMGLPTDTPGNLYSQYISPTASSTAAATRRCVRRPLSGLL